MKIRDKFEGCDPLIKTILQNDQEVFCNAETAQEMNIAGVIGHGPIRTWIVDYKMNEIGSRFYYDQDGIAYKKVTVIDEKV